MSERRVESEPPGHEATPAPSTSETAVSEPIDPESMLDAEVGTPFEHDRLHIVTSTQGVEAVGEIDHFGRMNVQYLRPTADPDVFELDVEPSLNADVQPSDEAEASKDAEEAEASEEVEDADDDGDDELAPLQPSHQSPRRSPRTSPHKRASPQSSRPASGPRERQQGLQRQEPTRFEPESTILQLDPQGGPREVPVTIKRRTPSASVIDVDIFASSPSQSNNPKTRPSPGPNENTALLSRQAPLMHERAASATSSDFSPGPEPLSPFSSRPPRSRDMDRSSNISSMHQDSDGTKLPQLRRRLSRGELDRDLVDLTDTALVDPSIPISRRDRLLKAAGNEPDFGKHNLHRLFRLFDRDNDGRLSHAEFQSGLLALGMEAKDPYAVGRLLKAIDRDNAGTIEEDEFVQFFKRLRMDDITRKLQGFSRRDPVRVKVVSYCASSNHAELNQHVEFDLAQFKDWLDNRHRLQKLGPIRSWVTVKGYDPNVADMLSVALDIHEEILQDVVTIQRDKIEIVGPPEKPFAHILASVYAMNNSPIYVPTDQSQMEESDASYGLANVLRASTDPRLVSKRHLDEQPPSLQSFPVSIVVVDESLMIVILRDPDVLDSPVYNVVRELEDQIIRRFPDVILGNVKYLAYLFLEAVSELNYDMRDVLKQWLEMIDDGISQTPRPEHRAHLFEYAKVSSLYMREMSALANRLHTLRWDAKVEPFSFFFQNELVYFQDLRDQLNTILDEAKTWNDTTQNLFQLYRSVQDEQTNNVLLLLTLVTTIFIPAQFLTGLWGMNFEEMPELHWRYGYVMFWSLVAGFTIITILWFRLSGYWQLSGH